MRRRMTIVFDDEALYTQLKVEAARSHRPAKDLVAEALCLYFQPRTETRVPPLAARTPADDILQQLGLTKERSTTPAR